jgi:hypothetical protein
MIRFLKRLYGLYISIEEKIILPEWLQNATIKNQYLFCHMIGGGLLGLAGKLLKCQPLTVIVLVFLAAVLWEIFMDWIGRKWYSLDREQKKVLLADSAGDIIGAAIICIITVI